MDATNEVLPFRCLIAHFPLFQVLTNLDTTLYVCTVHVDKTNVLLSRDLLTRCLRKPSSLDLVDH